MTNYDRPSRLVEFLYKSIFVLAGIALVLIVIKVAVS